MFSQAGIQAPDRHFLYATELLHRVHNEYTCAISLATKLAANSSTETKAALAQIVEQLFALARAHEVLRPPTAIAVADLGASLTQLCQAMTSSRLAQRGIELCLSISRPVLLDVKRSWRAQLIVSELITNASRHAFGTGAGCISVTVECVLGEVVCCVSDDGSAADAVKRGLGTELIDSLAADLGGRVERQYAMSGTTVTLSFPRTTNAASA